MNSFFKWVNKHSRPIVLDGRIDIVLEWRKKNWNARAFGISYGNWFFGFVVFTKKPTATQPGSYKNARGVLKHKEKQEE